MHNALVAAPTYIDTEIIQRKNSMKAHTSMGSPSAVPVPCASSDGPLSAFTASMSRYCEVPFGAVRLALGPSCCTAVPDTATSSASVEK